MQRSDAESRQHLQKVMQGFETAMLVTRSADGHLRSRPMAVAEVGPQGEICFSTAVGSPKVDEIEHDAVVNVSMQGKTQFLSLSGRARVVRDRALIDRLWKEDWKIWFPGGKDDPTLGLLIVDPDEAEYWDNAGAGGLKYLFRAAKAYVSGEKPVSDEDQNAKVRL